MLAEAAQRPAESDALGNCWVRLPGARGPGRRLMVAAHLDTVFPAGQDCRVRRTGDRWYGPGLGDNCAGLSLLVTGARLLARAGFPFAGELILAADVSEEGLGDLRGMKALCDRFGEELDAVLVLDGGLGQVVGAGVGSRRYRVSVKGPGGHSWSDFGAPSAVHHLARVAAALTRLQPPAKPRTTFNIGVIRGGTSVNSIAAEAELLLDLRSLDEQELARLDEQAQAAIRAETCPERLAQEVALVGLRPAGDPALTRDWVDLARAVWTALGVPCQVQASSSDANVPLSRGLPATMLGVRRGGAAHSPGEWLDPHSLPTGLEAFLLAALAALEILPKREGSRP
jgi:acetylornithine deacetylase/succinyl-diaminopimelate desuccinylase-like protein